MERSAHLRIRRPRCTSARPGRQMIKHRGPEFDAMLAGSSRKSRLRNQVGRGDAHDAGRVASRRAIVKRSRKGIAFRREFGAFGDRSPGSRVSTADVTKPSEWG